MKRILSFLILLLLSGLIPAEALSADNPGVLYLHLKDGGQVPEINVNYLASYRSCEVVPGINYRLVVNFAPETKPEATATDSLPTIVTISAFPMNGTEETVLEKDREVPALQMSAYENNDFSIATMGLDMKIGTHVTTSDVRNGRRNRIMRITETRLIPL